MTEPATALERATRRIRGIPVRNLYVMLAFAHALRNELSATSCGAMDHEPLPLEILAQLLLEQLLWVRRRGTPRSYRVRDDINAAPEGPLDLPRTLRGMHLLHNRVAFTVDELQLDTAHNRMLCAAVRALLRSSTVSGTLAVQLRRQLSMFPGVAYMSSAEALRVAWDHCPGAASSYRESLAIARLALLATLPDEGAEDEHWRRLVDDQKRMGELFEAFVRGFLSVEFRGQGHVSTPRFTWMDDDPSGLLPGMLTDFVIELPKRVYVGECKLYQSPLTKGRSGSDRLRSAHLNQLYAYLRAANERHPELEIDGLLVYGLVGDPFDHDLRLREHAVRVRTVDLACEWPQLQVQLRRLWPTEHD